MVANHGGLPVVLPVNNESNESACSKIYELEGYCWNKCRDTIDFLIINIIIPLKVELRIVAQSVSGIPS